MTRIADANEAPVFILTASRSGSTLMRFLLDSHPELACPPETGIASACATLARSWDVLGNAGSGKVRRVTDPITLSPFAAESVRASIDRIYDPYLRRCGKRRWCDKSLDSYQFADVVAQVYPDAKFICLFRHCMDVVASGVEACPWGLHRYGYDPFVAQHPGNSVAAIANYWLVCAQSILDFQEQHPENCHRVRYEDLVTAPEETAAAIFSFLGVAEAPGIAEECFRTPHEGDGPGDEKIWFTSGVKADSMGRGVTVPAAALLPPLREGVNETLAKLDYRQVDDHWNEALTPIDPRAGGASPEPADEPDGEGRTEVAAAARAVADRLERIGIAPSDVSERWPVLAGSEVRLVVQSAGGYRESVRVSFVPAAGSAGEADVDGDSEPVALIVAAPGVWRSLLDGGTNLVTELTTGRLRCVNRRDGYRIRSDEMHAVATLLGLAHIPVSRTPEGSPRHADASAVAV